MATKRPIPRSADAVILDVLRYELSSEGTAEAERKIRRRLRYHGLGPYRQERVNRLRRFKDESQTEILRGRESAYYAGSDGKFAAMEDFDVERMVRDFAESYPDVAPEDIAEFVPFAVYLWYLR